MEKTWNLLIDNKESILAFLAAFYELAVRLYPTKKSWSIVTVAAKIISFIIPDRATDYTTIQKTWTPGEGSQKKSSFTHIVRVLALVLLSQAAFSQVNGNFKSIRSYHSDSLTVKTEVAGAEVLYDSIGALYYNVQHSPAKWRIFYGHAWHDLPTGSGGATVTVSNGLGKTGNNIELGGSLLHSTSLLGNTQN